MSDSFLSNSNYGCCRYAGRGTAELQSRLGSSPQPSEWHLNNGHTLHACDNMCPRAVPPAGLRARGRSSAGVYILNASSSSSSRGLSVEFIFGCGDVILQRILNA